MLLHNNDASRPMLLFIVAALLHNLSLHAQCTPLVHNQINVPLSEYSITLADLTDGAFTSLSNHIPQASCPLMSSEYTFILHTEKGMRIPHSRMLVDGLKCGSMPDNATEKQLLADTYMQLMRIDALKDEDTARANHVYNAYYELHTLSRPFPRSFFDFMLRERNDRGLMTYVGFERFSPRICTNGKESVRLERGSLVFIGGVHGKNVSITQLISRLPKGEQVYLPPSNPYQITFTPDVGKDSAEHVCAMKLDWRNRLGKAGTSGKDGDQQSPNVRMCLPANALVKRVDGTRVRMEHVQIGDMVQSSTRKQQHSEVFLFTHRDARARTKMVSIGCANGVRLQLSHGHYVQTARGLTCAQRVRKGDVLETTRGASSVVRVSESWQRGLYNAHTLSGWMVVNDVLVSCYTSALPPCSAHALLTAVRAARALLGRRAWAALLRARLPPLGAPRVRRAVALAAASMSSAR